MARVDAIVQQQRAGHINLDCGLVANKFQHFCHVVRQRRHTTEEAQEEAAAVAGYAVLERRCANPGACTDCAENEEVISEPAEDIPDEVIEAAKAYLASEAAILAHDVMVGEAVAEALALDDYLEHGSPGEYPYTDYCDIYGCNCEETFGLDDDGEVRHYGC